MGPCLNLPLPEGRPARLSIRRSARDLLRRREIQCRKLQGNSLSIDDGLRKKEAFSLSSKAISQGQNNKAKHTLLMATKIEGCKPAVAYGELFGSWKGQHGVDRE